MKVRVGANDNLWWMIRVLEKLRALILYGNSILFETGYEWKFDNDEPNIGEIRALIRLHSNGVIVCDTGLENKYSLHYGYTDEEKEKYYIPIFKKAFETYAKSGETILSVVDKARKWGLKTLNGREMTKTCLDKLLDNKFYVGINVWNGIEYPEAQEKIISDELWEAVQVKKHGGGASKPKYKKHNALFRGLIHCSECGKLIVWQKTKGSLLW
jgi:hypothetical protein